VEAVNGPVDLLGILRVFVRRQEVQILLVSIESLLPGSCFLVNFPEAEICRSVIGIRPDSFFESAEGAFVIFSPQVVVADLYGFCRAGRAEDKPCVRPGVSCGRGRAGSRRLLARQQKR
jgi:hypothetical protein